MVHISANGKSLNAKPFSINTLGVLVHSKTQMGIYPAALQKYQLWKAVDFQRDREKKFMEHILQKQTSIGIHVQNY